MSEEPVVPDWPDAVESGEMREPAAESIGLAQFVAKSTAEDDEDRKYVNVVGMLHKLRNGPAILALSDGVTNHCVTSSGISVDGRTYWIYYMDPWGVDRGSFLQKGKNVAGVEARPAEGQPGMWAITHEELIRVLDSAITIDPNKKGEPAGEHRD